MRVNRQIRISPLRVIAPDGSQMGILDVETALAAAQEQGLDLVEVAPTARPPVVRIMDYGKFKFEQAKMARVAKKKQHVIHLKEVKYRPGIDDHDFDTKRVTPGYRGRQQGKVSCVPRAADRDRARAEVVIAAEQLADVAKIGRTEVRRQVQTMIPPAISERLQCRR